MSSPSSFYGDASTGPSPRRRATPRKPVSNPGPRASPGSSPSSAMPRPTTPTPARHRKQSSSSSSNSRRAGPTGVSPKSFRIKFNNRVYRPFAATMPRRAREMIAQRSGPLLGAPDELAGGVNAEECAETTRWKSSESIINCSCGRGVESGIDDGFAWMIQCDECDAWQHGPCMGYATEQDAPSDTLDYYCHLCAVKGVSRPEAQPQKDAEGSKASRWEREFTPPPSTSKEARGRYLEESQRPRTPSDSDSDVGLEVEQSSPSMQSLLSSPSASTSRSTPSTRRFLPSSPSTYSASRALLSQLGSSTTFSPGCSPSNARPDDRIRPSPSHPLLTPTRTGRSEASCHQAQKCGSSNDSSRIPLTDGLDPSTVPLPSHYSTLLQLHNAVERALLLYLATEGSKACGIASSRSQSQTAGDDPSDSSCSASATQRQRQDELLVELPNLLTLGAIRSTVERASGRKFGPKELGQLVWLWEGGLDGPLATEPSEPCETTLDQDSRKKKRGGLSMTVRTTRELDKTTSKKVSTWGIGIEIVLRQNVQLPQYQVVDDGVSESSVATLGGQQSPSASPQQQQQNTSGKRYAMSVMPLWSSRAEARKAELRRRLGQCVIKAHCDFAAVSSSKKASQHAEDPFVVGGFPTPPSSVDRKTSRNHSQNAFKKGFILDALPPIPSATLPLLGPASTMSSISPLKRAAEALSVGHSPSSSAGTPQANGSPTKRRIVTAEVDAETARRDIDNHHSLLVGGNRDSSSAVNKSSVPAEARAMSLLERIKAKEAAAAASAGAGRDSAAQDSLARNRNIMQNGKKNLSDAKLGLEAAGKRAKRRELAQAGRRAVM